MKTLTNAELNTVAGGEIGLSGCIDIESLKMISKDAQQEAKTTGIIAGLVFGFGTYIVANSHHIGLNVLTSAAIGIPCGAVMGVAAMHYSYVNYELWPWNH